METGIGVGRCVILFQNVGPWADTVCCDRLSRFLNVMLRFWTFTSRRGLSARSISVKAVTAELLRAKPSPFTGSLNGNKILVGQSGEIACVIVEKRGKNDWLYWGKEDKWMSYSGTRGLGRTGYVGTERLKACSHLMYIYIAFGFHLSPSPRCHICHPFLVHCCLSTTILPQLVFTISMVIFIFDLLVFL